MPPRTRTRLETTGTAAVTAPPTEEVLSPDRAVAVEDPKLAPYADFAFAIGSQFFRSYNFIDGMYDRGRHRYKRQYLTAGRISLTVDAQLGLRHAQVGLGGRAPAGGTARAANPAPGSVAAQVDQEHRELATTVRRMTDGPTTNTSGDTGFEPGPSRMTPPKALVAYQWTIRHTGTTWSKRLILEKPTRNDTLISFALDGVGDYRLQLRAYFTRNRYAEREITFSVTERFLVGMGESFASGQGNPDRGGELTRLGRVQCSGKLTTLRVGRGWTAEMDPGPEWLEPEAYRSLQGAQPRAAASLQTVYGETWHPDGGARQAHFDLVKVTWASFARTGAKIIDGLLNPQNGVNDYFGAGQIEECRRAVTDGRPIDALLLSIGGNDAGFAGTLSDLTQGFSFWTLVVGPAAPNIVAERLRTLRQALGVGLPPGQEGIIGTNLNLVDLALRDLAQTVPIKQIFVTGYPEDLFYVKDARGRRVFQSCGIFDTTTGLFSISEAEGEIIHDAAVALNALLKKKCKQFGWHFVETAPDFAGKGYCEGSMWVSADESCRTQGDSEGTMHPSLDGHHAAGERISAALKKHKV